MRVVAGLFVLLLMVGCSDKDNIPSGIIPREKMEKVLWDMVQADQYAALYLVKDSARINVKTETQKLYEEVFRLHQISRDDFRKSFQFYQEHPDLTRSVFDSLLVRGNRLRTESYSRPAPTPKPAVITPVTPPISIPASGISRPPISRPPGMFRPSMTAPKNPAMLSKPPVSTPGNPATKSTLPAVTPGRPGIKAGQAVMSPGQPGMKPGQPIGVPKNTGMPPKPSTTALKQTEGSYHPSATDTTRGKRPNR